MPSGLDLKTLAFSDEQVRSMSELIFDNLLKAPQLSDMLTIYTGIVMNREIGLSEEAD